MKIRASEVFELAKDDLCHGETGAVSEIEVIDKTAVRIINNIYKELFFKINTSGFSPINTLDDYIKLPEDIIYLCLVPGVAAKLAFDYGDGNLQAYFANLYNQGLNQFNTQTQVEDVLPSDYMN
ncbi:MAG: hypothetical protein IJO19_00205 [Clostridia bacterium]|nr:hypothetical protein [Clostridia bacterium]